MMEESEKEFSLRNLFVPFTALKAVHFLIIIGILIYANALFGGFVWDDISFILMSPELHSFNFGALIGHNVYNSGGYYRAVPSFYIATIYSIFGPTPFYFHVFQILLHTINGVLVFYFFKSFFRITTSFILAVIFLIHPTQVESVSMISSVQSCLFLFFGMCALLISKKDLSDWKNTTLVAIFLFLSLMTKETGILFFGVLILYQLLYKKRKEWYSLAFLILPILLYLFLRFFIAHDPFMKNDTYPIGKLPLIGRLMNIPEIIFFYIRTLFYPVKLAIDQMWIATSMDVKQFYFPLLIDLIFLSLLALIGIYVFLKKQSFRLYIFFSLWFFAGLGMLLQIFPLDMTVAERWMYFPLIGLLGILALGYESIKNRLSFSYAKPLSIFLITLILALLSIRTVVRNANYTNAFTLLLHDTQTEDNYDLENMLGAGYTTTNQFDKALPHLLKSNALSLRDSTTVNIGTTYEKLGNHEKAMEYFGKITTPSPSFEVRSEVKKSAYLSQAKLYLLYKDTPTAKKFIENAITLFPQEPSYFSYLAILQYRLGEQDNALASAAKAKSLLPNSTTAKLYDLIRTKKPINLR